MGRQESNIENYLRDRVKELGGQCRKVLYQGRAGSLDTWCFFPGGRLLIVECKRPRKNSLDPLQEVELKFLVDNGFNAVWVNSKEQVDQVLKDFFSAAGL